MAYIYDESGMITGNTDAPTGSTEAPIIDPTGNYTWVADSAGGTSGEWVKTTTEQTGGTYDTSGNYVPLVMGTGDHAASETTAEVLRGGYDTWKTKFFPKVEELMDMTTYNNPGLIGQQISDAQKAVTGSYTNVTGQQDRNLARYGMANTARQQSAADSSMLLSQSTALVNAANSARTTQSDLDKLIAAGGLPAATSGG